MQIWWSLWCCDSRLGTGWPWGPWWEVRRPLCPGILQRYRALILRVASRPTLLHLTLTPTQGRGGALGPCETALPGRSEVCGAASMPQGDTTEPNWTEKVAPAMLCAELFDSLVASAPDLPMGLAARLGRGSLSENPVARQGLP